MSRIYEALKNAQQSRLSTGVSAGDALGTMVTERRHSPRRVLDINLTVYGYADDRTPFYEQARAISGNHSGGLFLLPIPVSQGQDLLIINNQTSREQVCRVVKSILRDDHVVEVAVAFPDPNPEFWELPPLDETP